VASIFDFAASPDSGLWVPFRHAVPSILKEIMGIFHQMSQTGAHCRCFIGPLGRLLHLPRQRFTPSPTPCQSVAVLIVDVVIDRQAGHP